MPECEYRQEKYRLALCPSCRGSVQVKVFECSKYGECTQGKEVDGIHLCDEAKTKPEPPKQQTAKSIATPQPIPSHRPSEYETVCCGVHTSAVQPNAVSVLVKLDDGRDIVARNDRRRQGHKGKRCVVGYRNGTWILLQ